ncbi:LysR family transcriptional regulator [Vibrio sonorensis]|uniref:LysR family transcriptional regulator n=1 Tax=Vibrio sonorensis TaxID=1004316 RepID=UPI0008DAE795|nr:LysR family transcriptional regulator [Vibrio sonorensis]
MKDLNSLHVFVALFETGSTQRAALKIGRSQSHISKTLALLRTELNDPLFVRHNNRLEPTPFAAQMAPRLKSALEQVALAIEPEEFSPTQLEKVTIHMVEPFLIRIGKPLISAIRDQSEAVIELRQWNHLSQSLILSDDVDIGVHILSDKPQTLYQRRLHSGSGYFSGNLKGEFVKYVVAGVNEYTDYFKKMDSSIEPKVLVDNYALMDQLLDERFTIRYTDEDQPESSLVRLDSAVVMKATKRNLPKNIWLNELLSQMVEKHIVQ